MAHIKSRPLKKISSFRKIATSAWTTENSAQIFVEIDLPIEKIIHFLNKYNNHSPTKKATLTHVITYVFAQAFKTHPEINRFINWKGFRQRKTIDIFITTLLKKQNFNLSGITLTQANTLTFNDVVRLSHKKIKTLRTNKDTPIKRVNKTVEILPLWIAKPLISFIHWICYKLNISGPLFGFPSDRFGSIIITSLSSFKLKSVHIPLFPYSKTPYIVGIGAPEKKWSPNYPEGTTQVSLFITTDHRIIDGYEGAKFLKTIRKIISKPENWLHYDRLTKE